MLTRRGILGVLTGIIAGPAIVRASSLMPVKVTDITHLVKISGLNAYGQPIEEYIKVVEYLASGLDMKSYNSGVALIRPQFSSVTDITWTKDLLKPIIKALPPNALNGVTEQGHGWGAVNPSRTNAKFENLQEAPFESIPWPCKNEGGFTPLTSMESLRLKGIRGY